MTKLCFTCKITKDILEFHKGNKKSKDDLRGSCKDCVNKSNRVYYIKHRIKRISKTKLYVSNNPILVKQRAITRKYGLSKEQYLNIFINQNYKCCGCYNDVQPYTKSSCIDHDHKTKAVRGILCHDCNIILGHAKDKTTVLSNLIQYLERNRINV